ncbi:hypothetical protein GPECTOR_16g735 [Gonium pectorale]|uniref:Uncharacterized protein n=1 Tax=Gonium pectorale TaxID=33097 RepID=A0A150GMJ8_GONPE|nr:hypothetical protein GPECTOR_16g735 [Gonium pectorale]|eukprot:KXZ50560.1 hypothetical protein GPECTOR_16g735 [Gonium pectorale]
MNHALNRMNNMTGHKRKHQQTDAVKSVVNDNNLCKHCIKSRPIEQVNTWPCEDHKHMTKGGAKKQNAQGVAQCVGSGGCPARCANMWACASASQ